jgi:hypothetical protein
MAEANHIYGIFFYKGGQNKIDMRIFVGVSFCPGVTKGEFSTNFLFLGQ